MTPLLFENLLKIEGLPSVAQLYGHAKQGRLSLVNTAGVSLRDMYPEQALAPFDLQEFVFSDLFSQRPMIDYWVPQDPQEFKSAFAATQQDQFGRATRALSAHLRAYRSCVVFCHHGVGRSPAVALAALHTVWDIAMPKALDIVKRVRPQAHFSILSTSAAAWIAAQANA